MSLYEEALADAKKLKEVAEADAKQAIVDEITPYIRKMIAETIVGKSHPIYEDVSDDPLAIPGAPDAPGIDSGSMGTTTPTADASLPVGAIGDTSAAGPVTGGAVVGGPMDAPIQVAGADALNMPMPGADGKLVVDFDDLFVPSEPGDGTEGDEGPASAAAPLDVPGGMPDQTPVDVNPAPEGDPAAGGFPGEGEAMAVAGQGEEPEDAAPLPEPQMETYEMFSEAVDVTARRIHKAYSSKGVPSLVKEALQDKLFTLVEALEKLTEKKLVSENLSGILESRLEILHLKLQEALVGNTYMGTKGNNMASKSLKEFAAKMLSESDTVEGGDVTSPADVHKTEKPMTVKNANDGAADKAATHAMKLTEPTVTLKTEAAAMAKLEEELKALIAESEGDSLADDEGKQKLAGAASTIPNKPVGQVDVTKTPAGGPSNPASYVQGVSEEFEHNKETGSEEEVKKETVAVGGKALQERTKRLKAESLRKQISALREELKECGMEMEGNGLPAPGVPAKKSVMGEDDTVINFNFDLADLVPSLAGMGDDDEIEIVDDTDTGSSFGGSSDGGVGDDDLSALTGGGDAGGGSDLPSDLGSDGGGSDVAGTDLGGMDKPEDEEETLAERVARGRGPERSKALAENKALKVQLAEQTLFNAKVVHLQPFLNNKNLTKEQKQKIVEFLDRGRTINEVKTIYTRVKTVLENATKARAKAGSSSRTSGTGAASLNESASRVENLYEGATLVEGERNRLMELAGIRRK